MYTRLNSFHDLIQGAKKIIKWIAFNLYTTSWFSCGKNKLSSSYLMLCIDWLIYWLWLEARNLCCHWRWDYDQCNICKPWGSDMYITWYWGLQHHDRKQWAEVTWVPDLYYLWSILLYLYYTRLYCKIE
jgi:hypothetical protein